MKEWFKYAYKGAIKNYDTIVADRYEAETWARSIEEAKRNIAHQYRTDARLTARGNLIKVLGTPVVVARGGSRV